MFFVIIPLLFFTSYFSLASPLDGFHEAEGNAWKCFGDSSECVQGLALSKKLCHSNDDCAISCSASQETAGCFLKEERDSRKVRFAEPGKETKSSEEFCVDTGQFLHDTCGCLPKLRRCGTVTKKYFEVARIWSEYRLGEKCRTNKDCEENCKFAESRNGSIFGGLPCGCSKKDKICKFGLD